MSPSSHVFLWRHRVIVTLLDYFWRSAGRGGWGFTWERREREWEKVVLYFLTKKLVYLDGMRTPDSLMHWQSNSLSKSFPEWEMMMCCTSVKMHRMFVKYKVISRVVVSMFIKKKLQHPILSWLLLAFIALTKMEYIVTLSTRSRRSCESHIVF